MVLESNSRKPFSLQNGFGVQLTETISTAKWFCVEIENHLFRYVVSSVREEKDGKKPFLPI